MIVFPLDQELVGIIGISGILQASSSLFVNPAASKEAPKKGDKMAFQGGFGGGQREMHKAVCSDCKKECTVPFKPSGDRPVFCKDCFSKRKDSGR